MMSDAIWSIAQAVLLSLGGGGAIVLCFASWLGRVWADRVLEQTKVEHGAALERLRQDYALDLVKLRDASVRQAAEHAQLLSVQSQALQSSHPEVLHAMKDVWNSVMNVREAFSAMLFHHQILTRAEIPMNQSAINQWLPARSRDEFATMSAQVLKSSEAVRPFVGESLWHRFWTYRAFMGRLALNAARQCESGSFHPWDESEDGHPDAALRGLYRSALTEHDLASVDQEGPGAPQRIASLMVAKILDEMNQWIFGGRFMEMSIEQRLKIQKAIDGTSPTPTQPELCVDQG